MRMTAGAAPANVLQRLMGASLLVFLNKTDVGGCMTEDEVRKVCTVFYLSSCVRLPI